MSLDDYPNGAAIARVFTALGAWATDNPTQATAIALVVLLILWDAFR
jgi:hypothetical protein